MHVDSVTKQARRGAGRPRSFDREAALASAMLAFWKHGYEGASIPTLTRAMGITPQSLYAAFGSKAALYREALNHYADGTGAYAARALAAEADIFAALARVLRESAEFFTAKSSPRGCMVSLEMLSCSPEEKRWPSTPESCAARASSVSRPGWSKPCGKGNCQAGWTRGHGRGFSTRRCRAWRASQGRSEQTGTARHWRSRPAKFATFG